MPMNAFHIYVCTVRDRSEIISTLNSVTAYAVQEYFATPIRKRRLPPAELAVHPAEEHARDELYFMCDDLKSEISALREKGVRCSKVQEARWGSIVKIRLPGGGEVGLYQPKHPTAMARISH